MAKSVVAVPSLTVMVRLPVSVTSPLSVRVLAEPSVVPMGYGVGAGS